MLEQPLDAVLIRKHMNGSDTQALVDAINGLVVARDISASSLIAALTAALGQTIASAGPSVAPGVRAATFALIDGYAMGATLERADG